MSETRTVDKIISVLIADVMRYLKIRAAHWHGEQLSHVYEMASTAITEATAAKDATIAELRAMVAQALPYVRQVAVWEGDKDKRDLLASMSAVVKGINDEPK